MRAYAELHTCRREYLLQHFGDETPAGCGNCDICVERPKQALASSSGRTEPANTGTRDMDRRPESIGPFSTYTNRFLLILAENLSEREERRVPG